MLPTSPLRNLAPIAHSHFTRNLSEFKIPLARKNTRRASIQIAGPSIWNSETIGINLNSITSVYMFKNLLKAKFINSYNSNM